MTPSRFTPEQMREHAEKVNRESGCDGGDWPCRTTAILRQAAVDAEALADLQRKVKELRETFQQRYDDAGSTVCRDLWRNAIDSMDSIGLTPSPEQGATK